MFIGNLKSSISSYRENTKKGWEKWFLLRKETFAIQPDCNFFTRINLRGWLFNFEKLAGEKNKQKSQISSPLKYFFSVFVVEAILALS